MSGARAISLTPDTMLDSGGEADVYRVTGHPELLLKVFRAEPSVEDLTRIDRIIDRRNRMLEATAAWPLAWAQLGDQSALVLPFVVDAQPIHVLFDRITWIGPFPGATWEFMAKVARGAALAVAAIHAAGLAVVDISEKNMLVGRDGKITVIDCDSFVFIGEGAASISPCYSVGWPPPELAPRVTREPRTVNHDNFSLARLIFQLLFAGRAPLEPPPGSNPEDPRRVFGFSQIHRIRAPNPADVALSDLTPRIAGYFERAFAEPAAGADPRPRAQDWAEALMEMLTVLQPCGRASQHRYIPGGGRSCPWCRIAAAPRGTDPFRSSDQPIGPAPAASVPPSPRPPPRPPSVKAPPPPVQPRSAVPQPGSGLSFGWLGDLGHWLVRAVQFVLGWVILIGVGWFFVQHSPSLLQYVQKVERLFGTPTGASIQQSGSLEQRAATYAMGLAADFSNADASQILDQAYAGQIRYFGETRSHAFVMREKDALITRWPQRNYVPRAGSPVVNCNQSEMYCTVTLVTDFQVSNETRSKSGAWSSTVGLDMRRDRPVVLLEDGHAAQ